jgi:hypothetical protein
MVKTDVIITATAPLAAAQPETCRSGGIPHCPIDKKVIMRLVPIGACHGLLHSGDRNDRDFNSIAKISELKLYEK